MNRTRRETSVRARVAPWAAAGALALAACAGVPTVDGANFIQAGSFDAACSLATRQNDSGVARALFVVCNDGDRPSGEAVRDGLADRFSYQLVPGGPHDFARLRQNVAAYVFYIDTGERPLINMPDYPRTAIFNRNNGTCMTRFDLRPDGATTNICVQCDARAGDSDRAFEEATRQAVSTWLFPPAPIGQEVSATRRGLRHEIVFSGSMSGIPFGADAPETLDCTQPQAD